VSAYLEEIVKAFGAVHGAKAVHHSTVPVRESFKGKAAWEGEVECFALSGHAKASKGYAWGHEKSPRKWEITTVLELPPVNSPETAVRAAIVAAPKAH